MELDQLIEFYLALSFVVRRLCCLVCRVLLELQLHCSHNIDLHQKTDHCVVL